MPWGNIEERLIKPFDVRSAFAPGAILYPARRLDIDQWLLDAAETDQELSELDLPRLRFVENRWPMERLSELGWVHPASVTRRFLWATYVGHRTYIVYSGGFKYWLIAEIEQRTEPALYCEVLHKLLSNPDLVPEPPAFIRHFRPELFADEDRMASRQMLERRSVAPNSYMINHLTGWLALWIKAPALGYSEESTEELGQPH